jgi:hypothetical protein
MAGRHLRVGLLTLVIVLNPACSLILTKGPQQEALPPPECTTSNGAPIADAVLAVASAGVATLGVMLGVEAQCDQYHCPKPSESPPPAMGWGIAAFGVASAALFTTSAVVGFKRTAACREFQSHSPVSLGGVGTAVEFLPLALSRVPACPAGGDAPRLCVERAATAPSVRSLQALH